MTSMIYYRAVTSMERLTSYPVCDGQRDDKAGINQQINALPGQYRRRIRRKHFCNICSIRRNLVEEVRIRSLVEGSNVVLMSLVEVVVLQKNKTK